jgi:hypothetical protein
VSLRRQGALIKHKIRDVRLRLGVEQMFLAALVHFHIVSLRAFS